jgi:hypothetical protein
MTMTLGVSAKMLFSAATFPCLSILAATQSAQAETTLLSFTCRGEISTALEVTQPATKEQDTIGLVINLTNRTVSLEGDTVPITSVDDVIVYFGGRDKDAQFGISSNVVGQLDRVSGALIVSRNLSGKSSLALYNYKMLCKPTKRLF